MTGSKFKVTTGHACKVILSLREGLSCCEPEIRGYKASAWKCGWFVSSCDLNLQPGFVCVTKAERGFSRTRRSLTGPSPVLHIRRGLNWK